MWSIVRLGRWPLLDALGDAVLAFEAVAGHGPALAAEDLELVVAAAEPEEHLGRVEGVAELLAERWGLRNPPVEVRNVEVGVVVPRRGRAVSCASSCT